jgi:hypothetical protein
VLKAISINERSFKKKKKKKTLESLWNVAAINKFFFPESPNFGNVDGIQLPSRAGPEAFLTGGA